MVFTPQKRKKSVPYGVAFMHTLIGRVAAALSLLLVVAVCPVAADEGPEPQEKPGQDTVVIEGLRERIKALEDAKARGKQEIERLLEKNKKLAKEASDSAAASPTETAGAAAGKAPSGLLAGDARDAAPPAKRVQTGSKGLPETSPAAEKGAIAPPLPAESPKETSKDTVKEGPARSPDAKTPEEKTTPATEAGPKAPKSKKASKAAKPSKGKKTAVGAAGVELAAKDEAPRAEDASALPPGERAKAAYLKGVDHFRKDECDKAEVAFREALVFNPQLFAAREELCRTYEKQKKFDEAFAEYQAIAVQMPYATEAYVRMADICLERRDVAKALKTLDDAIAMNPEAPTLHESRGIICYHEGQPARAREEFLKELKIDPEAKNSKKYLKLIARKEFEEKYAPRKKAEEEAAKAREVRRKEEEAKKERSRQKKAPEKKARSKKEAGSPAAEKAREAAVSVKGAAPAKDATETQTAQMRVEVVKADGSGGKGEAVQAYTTPQDKPAFDGKAKSEPVGEAREGAARGDVP